MDPFILRNTKVSCQLSLDLTVEGPGALIFIAGKTEVKCGMEEVKITGKEKSGVIKIEKGFSDLYLLRDRNKFQCFVAKNSFGNNGLSEVLFDINLIIVIDISQVDIMVCIWHCVKLEHGTDGIRE